MTQIPQVYSTTLFDEFDNFMTLITVPERVMNILADGTSTQDPWELVERLGIEPMRRVTMTPRGVRRAIHQAMKGELGIQVATPSDWEGQRDRSSPGKSRRLPMPTYRFTQEILRAPVPIEQSPTTALGFGRLIGNATGFGVVGYLSGGQPVLAFLVGTGLVISLFSRSEIGRAIMLPPAQELGNGLAQVVREVFEQTQGISTTTQMRPARAIVCRSSARQPFCCKDS
jgi:hypothetical protein